MHLSCRGRPAFVVGPLHPPADKPLKPRDEWQPPFFNRCQKETRRAQLGEKTIGKFYRQAHHMISVWKWKSAEPIITLQLLIWSSSWFSIKCTCQRADMLRRHSRHDITPCVLIVTELLLLSPETRGKRSHTLRPRLWPCQHICLCFMKKS